MGVEKLSSCADTDLAAAEREFAQSYLPCAFAADAAGDDLDEVARVRAGIVKYLGQLLSAYKDRQAFALCCLRCVGR